MDAEQRERETFWVNIESEEILDDALSKIAKIADQHGLNIYDTTIKVLCNAIINISNGEFDLDEAVYNT